MQITFQNKNDASYEALFNALMLDAFGFSFAPWHAQRVWEPEYESYSIIENGVMLSNVCVYKMNLLIEGNRLCAHQLGAVATHSAHRGRGLARAIMTHIFEKYPDEPAFLLANDTVLNFYPRFGFRREVEHYPVLAHVINNAHIAPRKLAAESSLPRAYLTNGRRTAGGLDCERCAPIALFHLLVEFPQNIYHIAECDAFVVAVQSGTELRLEYVNMPAALPFAELARYLPFVGVERVRLGYMCDAPELVREWSRVPPEDRTLFVRGALPLPGPRLFPSLFTT